MRSGPIARMAQMLCAATCLAGASPGQASTVYASVTGSSSSTCGASSEPCLTIKLAMARAAAGGGFSRVVLVGPGVFNETVDIAKAMEIVGDGAHFQAIGPQSGAAAVTVAAGASDGVRFGNLQFLGNGGAVTTGLDVQSAATVDLENVEFHGFSSAAILDEPSNTNYPDMSLHHAVVADVGSTSGALIVLRPKTDKVNLEIFDSKVLNGPNGLVIDLTNTPYSGGGVSVLVKETDIFNLSHCVAVTTVAGKGAVDVTLRSSNLYSSGNGVQVAGPNSEVTLNGTSILDMGTAYAISGGATLLSYGDNDIRNNNTSSGTLTRATLQ